MKAASLFRSLRARLIIGAVIWIAIGVYASGIFIAELFRQFATSLVESELRTDMEELATLIDVDAAGFPHLARPLSDPRFGQDGSGFSWQVSRAGNSLIKSLSTSTTELPVANDTLETNEVRKLTLEGPLGPMIVYERLFLPEESLLPPLRIQVGAELMVIERMAPTFEIPLSVSLALLALACRRRVALASSVPLQLGNPEAQIGLVPCWGAITELPRVIGPEDGLEASWGKAIDHAVVEHACGVHHAGERRVVRDRGQHGGHGVPVGRVTRHDGDLDAPRGEVGSQVRGAGGGRT